MFFIHIHILLYTHIHTHTHTISRYFLRKKIDDQNTRSFHFIIHISLFSNKQFIFSQYIFISTPWGAFWSFVFCIGLREKYQFGPVRLAESWLKNTVLTELLWEKNTVPAKKRSRTNRIWGKPNGPHAFFNYLLPYIFSWLFNLSVKVLVHTLLQVSTGGIYPVSV